jgi:hypothetical protein
LYDKYRTNGYDLVTQQVMVKAILGNKLKRNKSQKPKQKPRGKTEIKKKKDVVPVKSKSVDRKPRKYSVENNRALYK